MIATRESPLNTKEWMQHIFDKRDRGTLNISECTMNKDGSVFVDIQNSTDTSETNTGIVCEKGGIHVSRIAPVWGYRTTFQHRRSIRSWLHCVRSSKTGHDIVCTTRYNYHTCFVQGREWTARYPVNELHVPLLQLIVDIIDTYYEKIGNDAAIMIQKHVRAWRSRRRYKTHKLRVIREIQALPPKHVYANFPGGEGYMICLERFMGYANSMQKNVACVSKV